MSDDWIEAAEDDPPKTEVLAPVPKREMSIREIQNGRLRVIEDEVFEKNLGVLEAVAEFSEVDPEKAGEVPEDLIESLGLKEATRVHRLRNYGLMSAKDAPVGIKIAAQIVTGIMRARSTEKAVSQNLNINVVQFTVPVPDQYEEVEVDNE
jgi:hypothetical protein